VKKLTTISMFMVSLLILMASCTKEGPAGADGADGTVDCIKCHDNSEKIYTRSLQWAASGHATGSSFERNSTSCAPCHTSQGFLEVLQTGSSTTADAISNPSNVNCYTCHDIHKTYTEDDWKLTTSDPVDFLHLTVNSDQGTANLCINCHQSRAADPWPDVNDPTGSATITSIRFGPHHGPQGNLFAGTGGYEIGTGYTNSSHTNALKNSCVDCHMGEAYGSQAGGHSMSMTYEYHGSDAVWEANCVSCHTDGATVHAKVDAAQENITLLLDSLGTILVNKGHLAANGYVTTGTYTNEEAGIIYNYKLVEEDRSLGVHNYPYIKTLLENSIAAAK
jgi:hypothetical protein